MSRLTNRLWAAWVNGMQNGDPPSEAAEVEGGRQPSQAAALDSNDSADSAFSWRERFRRDVIDKPTIRPLGGLLLTAIFGLVIGLAVFYAPSHFTADQSTAFSRGVIPVEAGYAAVLFASVIALAMAFEPSWRRQRFLRSADDSAPRSLIARLWSIFGHFWSFIDFVFADILARIAGATWSNKFARYGQGAAWVALAAAAGILAPAPLGLVVILFVLALIVGVARRWSWIEADRGRYMIEHGRRQSAELAGFKNDLRDEALIGVVCLFVLTPLALAQIQGWTCAGGDCAFKLKGGYAMPEGPFAQWLAWLGFFGAELAKALPFVDWSEVFRVENDSPIEAARAFGATVVFLTRASLDLLLLAAILQAVQVASQLRAQRDAFEAEELPVLEPFEERIEFERVRRSQPDGLELPAHEQPALARIKHYDVKRLEQIVENAAGEMTLSDRQIAAATLTLKTLDRKKEADAPAIEKVFTVALAREKDEATKRWLARIANGMEPEPANEEARAELPEILGDRRRAWAVRAAAARALGRKPLAGDVVSRLSDIAADEAVALKLRADAGLTLAKQGADPARKALEALSEQMARRALAPGYDREALLTVSHALARLGEPLDAVQRRLKAEDDAARFLVERGWRIQSEPMDAEQAKMREVGEAWDQLVRLTPGEGPFDKSFMMGCREDETPNEYYPRARAVTMPGPFAVGRYSVTMAELDGYRRVWDIKEPDDLTVNRGFFDQFGGRAPGFYASRRDASAYCGFLSRVTGDRLRLLTEAEWEYACRAGTTTTYAWGDEDPDRNRANFQGAFREPIPVEGFGDAQEGAYCNDWGLWQMHGNAAEWCVDQWSRDASLNPKDGSATPLHGDFSLAVLRGGSWNVNPQDLRSAYRLRGTRDSRLNSVGFRVSRTLVE